MTYQWPMHRLAVKNVRPVAPAAIERRSKRKLTDERFPPKATARQRCRIIEFQKPGVPVHRILGPMYHCVTYIIS